MKLVYLYIEYDNVRNFHGNLAAVERKGQWLYIDKKDIH